MLGKGNMGEWAFSPIFSISSVAGVVRNPYDLDRTPAGSSGGPAAGGTGAPHTLSNPWPSVRTSTRLFIAEHPRRVFKRARRFLLASNTKLRFPDSQKHPSRISPPCHF